MNVSPQKNDANTTAETANTAEETSAKQKKNGPPPLPMAINRINRLVIDAGASVTFRYEYNHELPESKNDLLILESVSSHHRIEKPISESKVIDENQREITFEGIEIYSAYHFMQQSGNTQAMFYIFEHFNIEQMTSTNDEQVDLLITDWEE